MPQTVSYSIPEVNARLRAKYGNIVTRQQLLEFRQMDGVMATWLQKDPALRTERGVYRIPDGDYVSSKDVQETNTNNKHEENDDDMPVESANLQMTSNVIESLNADEVNDPHRKRVLEAIDQFRNGQSMIATVPKVDPAYVPFGNYEMIRTIVRSKMFFPIYITGLSGNGKTMGTEQACANENREFVHASITPEVEEDDLLGGFRLRNGETVFELGPVSIAAIRGAVLLLDELDTASPKILCLQRVMEGKPFTLKKFNVTIIPSPGFTVIATANTKGRGNEDGRFVGTGLLNEAFIERFPITIEQEYPDVKTEQTILQRRYKKMGKTMTQVEKVFFKTLAQWADSIRETFKADAVEDVISTRRLCHIVDAYVIFGDQAIALAYCLNRFDKKVQDIFGELYNKLVPDEVTPSTVGHKAEEIPF